jgi:hypothetical protein
MHIDPKFYVSNEKATKGVLICTSEFTREARKIEAENYRLELINNEKLQLLLSEHLGSDWQDSIYWFIPIERDSKHMEEAKKDRA